MTYGKNDEWPDAKIERLRALWGEGLSASKIADKMGITKNMVVGKARRLHLAPRKSTILRDSETREHRPMPPARASKMTLPSLKSIDRLSNEERAMIKDERQPMLPKVLPKKLTVARFVGCQFIPGNPRARPVVFCDAETAQGRPYCAAHVRQCYAVMAAAA